MHPLGSDRGKRKPKRKGGGVLLVLIGGGGRVDGRGARMGRRGISLFACSADSVVSESWERGRGCDLLGPITLALALSCAAGESGDDSGDRGDCGGEDVLIF